MTREESYRFLNVKSNASREEIKKAFDQAIMRYRAKIKSENRDNDRHQFKKIVDAYKVLIQEKREKFRSSIQPQPNVVEQNQMYEKNPPKDSDLKNESENVLSKGSFKNARFALEENLVTLMNPKSFASEQYRVLFTRIRQISKEKHPNLIAITSSVKGEGKTTTALNLSTVVSRDFSHKTLLIDLDFKNPNLNAYIEKEMKKGLGDILLGNASFEECLVNTQYENLFLLPAGREFENSSRLINHLEMRKTLLMVKQEFEYVFLDTPPVLPLADMNILSHLVDGIIFVVQAGNTSKEIVKKAFDSLPPKKILGITLNQAEGRFSNQYLYP